MRLKILLILFLFCGVTANAQVKDTVTISVKTAQACDKAFDEVLELRPLVKELLEDKANRIEQDKLSQEEIKSLRNSLASEKNIVLETNKLLELERAKKCSTLSFLFGLIKSKKC